MHANPPDEEQDSQPAAEVAADVGAEGQAPERQRDQPHDLPEDGSGLVTGQRYRLGERGSCHGASLPRGGLVAPV